MKARVLLVSPLPPPECGMATYTRNILDCGLVDRYDFSVLNTGKPYWVSENAFLNILNSVKNFMNLLYLLQKDRPAIALISTSSFKGFYEKSVFLLSCRLFRIKTVLVIHGGAFIDFYQKSKFKDFIAKTLDSAEVIVVLGEYWEKKIQNMARNRRVVVIKNCVNVLGDGVHARSNDGVIRVIFVGRLEKEKGVYDLIDAARILNKESATPRVVFDFIGKDVEEVSKSNKMENVSFLGELRKEELMKRYSQSDIFVLPSYYETSSFVLLEAMSAGLPIVSTDIPPSKELVEHGENGFLFPSGDSKKLVEYIVLLAGNPSLRRKMGGNNSKKVRKRYSLEKFSSEMDRLFGSLISDNFE